MSCNLAKVRVVVKFKETGAEKRQKKKKKFGDMIRTVTKVGSLAPKVTEYV